MYNVGRKLTGEHQPFGPVTPARTFTLIAKQDYRTDIEKELYVYWNSAAVCKFGTNISQL